MAIPKKYDKFDTKEEKNVLAHSLFDLIINPVHRTAILHELRACLHDLDARIVTLCQTYLENNPDVNSMLYQTARNYLRENYMRRPLYISIQTLSKLLANPNFFREFFAILVIFVQFRDVVKNDVAPHTIEPVFRRYFGSPSFYSRFLTFMPDGKKNQTVDSFIHAELSHLLVAVNIGKQ